MPVCRRFFSESRSTSQPEQSPSRGVGRRCRAQQKSQEGPNDLVRNGHSPFECRLHNRECSLRGLPLVLRRKISRLYLGPCQVQFTVVPADVVWVVPATTLIARAAGPQVVTVRGDGTVHYLGVHLGRDLGQSVEILSGLTGR